MGGCRTRRNLQNRTHLIHPGQNRPNRPIQSHLIPNRWSLLNLNLNLNPIQNHSSADTIPRKLNGLRASAIDDVECRVQRARLSRLEGNRD